MNLFEGSIALTGIFLSATAIGFFAARLKDQQRQTEIQTNTLKNQQMLTSIQIRKEINERFNAAIALLDSKEESARTGAIYSLHRLATENSEHHDQVAAESKKYRNQVAKILCAHIRNKTKDEAYRSKNEDKPSNEIQTAIDLLFKETNEGEGLYSKFIGDLSPANLYAAYLVGADFVGAQCQKVIFSYADCQGAIFLNANCHGANFRRANCQESDFRHANCQEAIFLNANCKNADFYRSNCQEAIFSDANYQEASFEDANLSGTVF